MPAEDGKGSLLDKARALSEGKRADRIRCTIGKLLLAHPDLAPEIQELMDAARDEHLSYAVAAETLSAAVNDKVDGQTISRHQRHRCRCS